MIDPRDYAAFWGLCGGLFYGAIGLITAYSAKVGNPVARRKAWLEMMIAPVFGPICAEAVTVAVLAVMPGLGMPAVALTTGFLAVPCGPVLFNRLKEAVLKRLGANDQ
ncbi:hypothetical protein [Brevundimonas sp. NIBR11]|uniref:hypothetical protein n=1 Tax=Brevundimonas sp. NIBR11 TaxID=3015999 RepID=UPI0022F087F7|nr:hypothetical protein [Brevundimonas sp. NIBR11]WGM31512.1 hypothetical protein KKHFBJBL_01759 [Brevundimonas sp. NIBR11]